MSESTRTPVVAIRGGGDLGTACALRIHRCGIRVAVIEQPVPTAVRRTVALSEAVFDGRTVVEGVVGVLISHSGLSGDVWEKGGIPILVDAFMERTADLGVDILIDAMMNKQNCGMGMDLAPGTIALGPGFTAGVDVHAVVETNRGPDLGRILWSGSTERDTHIPAPVGGHAGDRVLRSPRKGPLRPRVDIGTVVEQDELIAEVSGDVVVAPFRGLVRGMLRPNFQVRKGMKIGDIDPRLDPNLCGRLSDKALAVAGGVLEASIILLTRSGWRLTRERE